MEIRLILLVSSLFAGISIGQIDPPKVNLVGHNLGIDQDKSFNMMDLLSMQSTTTNSSDSNTTLIGRWANGHCFAVDVSGTIAYFGNGGYLEVVDISDLSNPVELGKILTPSIVRGVVISGSYVYVIAGEDGLRIIDVSTPSSPQEVGFFKTDNIFAFDVWSAVITSM